MNRKAQKVRANKKSHKISALVSFSEPKLKLVPKLVPGLIFYVISL